MDDLSPLTKEIQSLVRHHELWPEGERRPGDVYSRHDYRFNSDGSIFSLFVRSKRPAPPPPPPPPSPIRLSEVAFQWARPTCPHSVKRARRP